ncbi:U4/U6 small nuclear ribonucleoprotein Prp3 isoform X2 [Vanessa atalanta]|uniref:U4/U6 small nuclear ribonucleoprotein Prp3 isoform X2 n=1 Tax=Vanessa atalanta TaxID=42275 RepID=UPI001FCCC3EA|nr:U4/U6 small nuclear ribonucleoprotein Prp3 isoform X2 [Vanessa atalanta]
MAYQLSRREVEDLRSSLDRAIYRTIGKSDSSLLSTVSSCLTNGYERRKIIDKISSHIDSKKASKLADKVIALAQELVSTSKTQKRKYDDKDKDKDSKRSRHDDRHESRDEKRDRDRDKDREDKEKKADNGMELPSILPDGETIGSKMAGLSADKIKVMMANAQKEIEERKRALLALKGEPRNVTTAAAAAQQIKVQMQQNNAIPPPSVIKPVLYSKPAVQPITAEELEKQRKIAELQARIQRKLAGGALAAAGASGPAPLILDREGRTIDTSGKRVQLTHVAPTLKACNLGADDIVENVNEDAITNLVEHPQQLRPPTEPLKPTYMPVFLTKKERKKLRRQSRREAWKEEQEKVRLGLEAPPEPKLRISNLMRALGTEAVQDPTAIEAKVREQIAKRQKTHLEANKARALTKDQKREKIDRKIREDTSMSVHVAVYRVKDLFECASAKFKVEVNAQQLHMTGCVVLHRGCCVIVVEGGPKQHAKYKRLMLHRIKWEEEMVKDADGQQTGNSCHLVWEGSTSKRAFGDIKFKVMPTEKQARELFHKHGVEHYWDLAYSGAVLGAGAEEP